MIIVISITGNATVKELYIPFTTGYPAGLSISPVGPGAEKPRTRKIVEKVGFTGTNWGGLWVISEAHMKALTVI